MATQPGIYKEGIMSRPVATTVADVYCISTTRSTGQLQAMQRCQKLKTGRSFGMEVAGIKMGKLPEHKATSYMVSKQYRKMKIISYNLANTDMYIMYLQRDTSKSNEIIISRINIEISHELLVSALKDDNVDTLLSVVKSICKEHGLPQDADAITAVIQGIQNHRSGDTLIHAAARHKAKDMLELICRACPALLTAKNQKGDTVWHVVASEGVDQLLKLLRYVRRQLLVNPETCKGGKNQHFRLNAVNNEGNTALHTAIVSGNESIANGLFEMIHDHESSLCYLQNHEKKSAIYLAAEAGYENMLRRMMNAAMKDPQNLRKILKGKSIIHAAVTGKQLVSLNVIMEEAPELFLLRDETGMTPLQSYADGSLVADLKPKLAKLLMGKHLLMGKLQ